MIEKQHAAIFTQAFPKHEASGHFFSFERDLNFDFSIGQSDGHPLAEGGWVGAELFRATEKNATAERKEEQMCNCCAAAES